MAGTTGRSKLVQTACGIREGLQDYWPDFEISLEEILNPTLHSATIFFEKFLSEFGVDIDYQMQLLQDESNSRCFNDIIYIFLLKFNVNQMAHYLNVHGAEKSQRLNLTDFLKPDATKLRVHIMLLTNVVYYAAGKKITTLQPIKEKVFASIKKLEEFEKKVKKLEDSISFTSFSYSKNVDKLERLKEEHARLEQEVAAGQLEVQENDIKIQKLLAQLKVAEEENDKAVKGLEKEIYRKKHLESLLVKDPESILSEREEVENDVKDLEAEIKTTIKKLEEQTKMETTAQKNLEILKKYIDEVIVITEIEKSYKTIEEFRNKEDDCRKQIVTLKKSQNDISNKIAQVKQAIVQCEEKYQSFVLKADAKNKCMDNEIEQLKAQIEIKKKQSEKLNSHYAEIENKRKHIAECCEQYKINTEKQNKFYQKQYESILKMKKDLENKAAEMLEKIEKILPE